MDYPKHLEDGRQLSKAWRNSSGGGAQCTHRTRARHVGGLQERSLAARRQCKSQQTCRCCECASCSRENLNDSQSRIQRKTMQLARLHASIVVQFHSIWCNCVSRFTSGERHHYSQRSCSHLPFRPYHPCLGQSPLASQLNLSRSPYSLTWYSTSPTYPW